MRTRLVNQRARSHVFGSNILKMKIVETTYLAGRPGHSIQKLRCASHHIVHRSVQERVYGSLDLGRGSHNFSPSMIAAKFRSDGLVWVVVNYDLVCWCSFQTVTRHRTVDLRICLIPSLSERNPWRRQAGGAPTLTWWWEPVGARRTCESTENAGGHCRSDFSTARRSIDQGNAERHQICRIGGASCARWSIPPSRSP